jgi:phage-related protein
MPIKGVDFRDSSLADLRLFPVAAKWDVGYQLDRVQRGSEPTDSKSMRTVGKSVYEIRVEEPSGAFRVIYIAKFEKFVYVLHCFQKKSKRGIATPKEDMDIINARLKIAEAFVKEYRK